VPYRKELRRAEGRGLSSRSEKGKTLQKSARTFLKPGGDFSYEGVNGGGVLMERRDV